VKKPTICDKTTIIIAEIDNLEPPIDLLSLATIVALLGIFNAIVANQEEEITSAATITIIEDEATIEVTTTTEDKITTTKEDDPTTMVEDEITTMSDKATTMKIKANKQILQVLTIRKLLLSSQHLDLPTDLNDKLNLSLQSKKLTLRTFLSPLNRK
jgi:hypothetical protein